MHGRHLRLVLHVVHGVHEVLLVRHAVLHHVLLRVHVVGHLLRLLQRRTARHATRRRRRRLQLTRRVHRWRWWLVTVGPIPVCRLWTHVPHLRRTVRPIAILFHLLVIPQSVVRRKPGVGHAGCWLRGVVVLCRPELLVAALHLVALLRHRAVVRVRLLVLMAAAVPHIGHVGVGEVGHAIAVVGAHRGPAARAARVRIFRCRFSAPRADTTYHSLVTTQTLRIPFTTRQLSVSLIGCSVLTDGVSSSDSSSNLKRKVDALNKSIIKFPMVSCKKATISRSCLCWRALSELR